MIDIVWILLYVAPMVACWGLFFYGTHAEYEAKTGFPVEILPGVVGISFFPVFNILAFLWALDYADIKKRKF